MDAAKIKDALSRLDPANDAHWTATGKPDIQAVSSLMGPDEKVTRSDINSVDANFERDTAGGSTSGAGGRAAGSDRASDPRRDPGPALDAGGRADMPAAGGSQVERNKNVIFEKPSAEMEGSTTRPNARADIGAGPGGADRNLALAQRRAALEQTLGTEDERTAALAEERPDMTSRGARIMGREERLRTADRDRTLRSQTYTENSKVASEHGATAAADWVDGVNIKTLDRRYYGGKIYERNEIIRSFTGRMPARAIVVA